MNIQILVVAMNQQDFSLIEKMNIKTDAIVANQCDKCSNEEYEYLGHKIKYYNRPYRGVGLNRNEALLHSDGEILTFADEDMTFVDGYEEIIKKAFTDLPDADGIIFNIQIEGSNRTQRENVKAKRIHFFNAFNYGAARLSVKASSLKRENILFHTCFGGGTIYNAGEDSILISDMLKRKLKLYVYPVCIAKVDQSSSTWFSGYNMKFLHDKGVLFCAISKRWAKFLCLQDLIRHKNIYRACNAKFIQAYKMMKTGINNFKNLETYTDN